MAKLILPLTFTILAIIFSQWQTALALFAGCFDAGDNILLPEKCRPCSVAENPYSKFSDVVNADNVDPNLYGKPGYHYVPCASKYYLYRMAKGVGSPCPGNSYQYRNLSTPWTGVVETSVAYDIVDDHNTLIVRDCIPPTATDPFICTGRPGTPGTFGTSLGTLSYSPVLSNGNEWAMFVQFWPWKGVANTGKNCAQSWNVFSTRKYLTQVEKDQIFAKAAELGFNVANAVCTNYPEPAP